MATLPAFLRRTNGAVLAACPDRPERLSFSKPDGGPFQLRALPQEDVFFFCKKIDNSRLVREPDPQARGACWSAIGAASVVLALLSGVLAPSVANTLAGYKIEALRGEERRLLDERRVLEVQEAELRDPARLERLALSRNLATPRSEQVVHLDGRPDGAVAMVKRQ
ncbi:MAG: hypothetical protein LAP87_18255 [Acidobacteriia bacterium]|nr:hypothetical protein [Terriglobia bacterium]